MSRAHLRTWLMTLAFGADPAPLLQDLRRALAAWQARHIDLDLVIERLERLEELSASPWWPSIPSTEWRSGDAWIPISRRPASWCAPPPTRATRSARSIA